MSPAVAASLVLLASAHLARAAGPTDLEPQPRTTSATGQFVVFAEDAKLRRAVAAFAEDVKAGVCGLLGARPEAWDGQILINFVPGSAAAPGLPPSQVRLLAIEENRFKAQIDARLDAEPADVALERQILRAVLLEFSYRGQQLIRAGEPYAEPPAWLVAGAGGQLEIKRRGINPDIFKSLIGASRLPSISQVLYASPAGYDTASRALYEAYCLSLLQLLADQPQGRASLAKYVREMPRSTGDPVADLMACFPQLGGSVETLEKWWTLSMARLSAAGRYEGLPIEESEAQLEALLAFDVPSGKKGETKTLALGDYRELSKSPVGRSAVSAAHDAVVGLAAVANPLYRPVLSEYERLLAQIARGKTRGIAERIESAKRYRELVSQRMGDIIDYLNWFEATQMFTRSHAFDAYLRATRNADTAGPAGEKDPLRGYLDGVEKQFR